MEITSFMEMLSHFLQNIIQRYKHSSLLMLAYISFVFSEHRFCALPSWREKCPVARACFITKPIISNSWDFLIFKTVFFKLLTKRKKNCHEEMKISQNTDKSSLFCLPASCYFVAILNIALHHGIIYRKRGLYKFALFIDFKTVLYFIKQYIYYISIVFSAVDYFNLTSKKKSKLTHNDGEHSKNRGYRRHRTPKRILKIPGLLGTVIEWDGCCQSSYQLTFCCIKYSISVFR